ncbi:MAG: ABC transporter permease subunit [Myxococcota bacterium]
MTGGRGWRRIGRRRGTQAASLVLAGWVLLAIFLEVLAAPAPLVARGKDGWWLPAVSAPERFATTAPAVVRSQFADQNAVYPLWPHGPETVTEAGPRAGPSWAHPLGTDHRARDVWVRVLYGARVALSLASLALAMALALGLPLGTIAGHLGAGWDDLLSRPLDLVHAVPTVVVVALVRVASPDDSVAALAAAIGTVKAAEVARLVRAEVVQTGEEGFVLAARALGADEVRLLRRHILPRAVRPALAAIPFGLASIVVLEAVTAFLGLGLPGSWGAMLAEGLDPSSPVVVPVAAATALGSVMLSCTAFFEVVNDAMDAPSSSH